MRNVFFPMRMRPVCRQLSKGESVSSFENPKGLQLLPSHRSSRNMCMNPNVISRPSASRRGGAPPRREQAPEAPLPAWGSQCSCLTHTQSRQEKQVSSSPHIISRSNLHFSTNGLLYGYSCWIANNKTYINQACQICSTVGNKMRASIRKKEIRETSSNTRHKNTLPGCWNYPVPQMHALVTLMSTHKTTICWW